MENYYSRENTWQLLATITLKMSLLDNELYNFIQEDFASAGHRDCFATLKGMYLNGATIYSPEEFQQYANEHYITFDSNEAVKNLEIFRKTVSIENFKFYYDRMKKDTLLRQYQKAGYDVSSIVAKKNNFVARSKEIEELTLDEISDIVEDNILSIRERFVDGTVDKGQDISDGIEEFLEQLKQEPDIGLPLQGSLLNTATRGARLGKFYLRSASAGSGKSRALLADCLMLSCSEYYVNGEWKSLGPQQHSLFISTELEKEEVVTMALAFLSNVNEEHILRNSYDFGEIERVQHAIEILKETKMILEVIPDFNLKDIENCIKRHIRKEDCRYIFYDYIHTSMRLLEEITRRSGGVKLREDNVLFLMSAKLKEIAVEYNVFIYSATQLNGSWKTEEIPDQNLLRGAKSIADKIDYGSIMLNATEDDLKGLENLIKNNGLPTPNMKISIYKNRRGSINGKYIWVYADKGCCRFENLFVTDYYYNYVETDILNIEVEEVIN